ncbi:hypothetical protein FPV67DRAFT_1451035 [Lyophyllum atratum]|nr:hypothetical protein FPV67DRAFT_1451035 [Lyophyllum atratum]
MPMGLEPMNAYCFTGGGSQMGISRMLPASLGLGFRGRGREIVEFILRARSYDEKRTWCQKPELLLSEPASAANLDELRESGSSSGAASIREDREFHARVWVISTPLGFRMKPKDAEPFRKAMHPLSWRTRVQEELLPGWSGTPPFVDHL